MTAFKAPMFQDEAKAREALEAVRWPDGPFCPHCGNSDQAKIAKVEGKKQSHRPGLYYCNECKGQFTVTVGTVFERSKVPLTKWWMAAHLLNSSKKGMSAHQIHRMLGVTYKTAWFMCHRIREAMDQDSGPLGGSPEKIVEADETYVGGKSENRAFSGIPVKQVVVTLVERDGRARSFHGANVHAATIRPLLFQHADRLSTLMTDEASAYTKAGQSYWSHETVVHRDKQYSKKGGWHTNTVENFFSIFKRGIIGVYHHVSEAHLGRYAREFDFRYNHRSISDGERSDQLLRGIVGKRLMYRRPHALAA
jgi:transposase-like protein